MSWESSRPVNIAGYEDYYRVDEAGQVWSLHSRHGFRDEPLLRTARYNTNPAGHATISLRRPGQKQAKLVRLHRLVAVTFPDLLMNTRDAGPILRHLDDDKTNNHVSNIAWGTSWDNTQDSIRNDTWARGMRHGCHKLTDDEVYAIRQDPRPSRAIADDYGVDKTTILNIRNRKNWKHLR
jgi:hypothetical protein